MKKKQRDYRSRPSPLCAPGSLVGIINNDLQVNNARTSFRENRNKNFTSGQSLFAELLQQHYQSPPPIESFDLEADRLPLGQNATRCPKPPQI